MNTTYQQCAICGRTYQYGPHRYDGKSLQLYGNISCCLTCWQSNHDGWAPHVEEKLLKVLEENGISVPCRNSKGLLPRE